MSRMYTQEEVDAAILYNSKSPESIESKLKNIEYKMDSHFRWIAGLLIGLYPIMFAYIFLMFK